MDLPETTELWLKRKKKQVFEQAQLHKKKKLLLHKKKITFTFNHILHGHLSCISFVCVTGKVQKDLQTEQCVVEKVSSLVKINQHLL